LNSKLLLFGEYGLMVNAMALTVPYPRFSGSLDFDTPGAHAESSVEIEKFYNYLTCSESQKLHFPFDLQKLKADLQKGLYFNSNIPQQYGLGSSGALVAVLFSRYAASEIPAAQLPADLLKVDFALLESHFHGKSSGLDPLVSFLNQPLLLDSKKMVQPVSLNLAQSGWSFGLIDTHTTGATGPLVQYFIDQLKLPDFKSAFDNQFVPSNNGCIESLLKNDHLAFFIFLRDLIYFELEYFIPMIPTNFHSFISEAIEHQVFIKLLGSGGGGFLLAISPSEIMMDNWASANDIPVLKIA